MNRVTESGASHLIPPQNMNALVREVTREIGLLFLISSGCFSNLIARIGQNERCGNIFLAE